MIDQPIGMEAAADIAAEIASEEPAKQEEISERLDVALQRLLPEPPTVIELAYGVGHSCEEIASIMLCTPAPISRA